MYNYNHSRHGGHHQKPIDVYKDKVLPLTILDDAKEETDDLAIGDKVRTKIQRKMFDKKSFLTRWSKVVYEIVGKKHNRYYIRGRPNKGYLRRDLQKVSTVVQSPEGNSNVEEAVRTVTNQNTMNRRQRREVAIGHEAELDEEGRPVLKQRLQPRNRTRERKKPRRYG